MKRRLAATALILMLPLGMAACGSTQSTADACKEIATARDAVLKESESVDISSMNSQQEYADFLAKFPTSAEQLNNLGVHYALAGNYKQAAECFRRAGNLPQAVKNLQELSKVER